MIHVYVGSDANTRVRPAEVALEWSIRKHTRAPVSIHWMRAGEGDFADQRALAGTHTVFTPYRFWIPYLHTGRRALYLDVDMLVLGDLAELWTTPQTKPWLCTPKQPYNGKLKYKTEVSLIDCQALRDARWYPSLRQLQTAPSNATQMARLLDDRGALGETLPIEWNCIDGYGYVPDRTKLLHFSGMPTQPWEPYPERFSYDEPHPCPQAVALWCRYLEEASAATKEA